MNPFYVNNKTGYAGMIASTEPDNIITSVLDKTSPNLSFGFVALRGTQDRSCKAATAAGKFMGVACYRQNLDDMQYDTVNDVAFYKPQQVVSLMVKGTIWVKVKTAVNAGDPAGYDPATGQLQVGGTAISGAEFITSAMAGGLAELRLNGN
jgi:hypothetical protein